MVCHGMDMACPGYSRVHFYTSVISSSKPDIQAPEQPVPYITHKPYVPLGLLYQPTYIHTAWCCRIYSLQIWRLFETRMHSSKMRIARLLTVCHIIRGGCLPRGAGVSPRRCLSRGCLSKGCLPKGVSVQGCVYPSMQWGRHPPPCEQNHRQV